MNIFSVDALNTVDILIYDGDEISKELNTQLTQFAFSTENDIFTIIRGKIICDFVGFLPLIGEDEIVNIYSFPKHYIVDSVNKNIDEEMSYIITILRKLDRTTLGILASDNEIQQKSIFKSLLEIEEYYKKYGIYKMNIKQDFNKSTGKIYWKKTITKNTPQYSDGQMFFEKYRTKKNVQHENILSLCMKYALMIAGKLYSFYFSQYSLEKSELKTLKQKNLVYELKTMKRSITGDRNIILIDNIISIFEEFKLQRIGGPRVITKNFNTVWEKIISFNLPTSFEHQYRDIISSDQHSIKIDHLDIKNRILLDSKYYKNDSDQTDYKQLFYNYHMLTKDDKFWLNLLIKPCAEQNVRHETNLNRYELDKIIIFDLYIPMSKICENYAKGLVMNDIYNEIQKLRISVCTQKSDEIS